MAREVTGSDDVVWTCIQAYAGLHEDNVNKEAAVDDATGNVTVVCTPTGGARSVRLELSADWESALQDDALVKRIEQGLDEQGSAR